MRDAKIRIQSEIGLGGGKFRAGTDDGQVDLALALRSWQLAPEGLLWSNFQFAVRKKGNWQLAIKELAIGSLQFAVCKKKK
jgi:hypothetical protein